MIMLSHYPTVKAPLTLKSIKESLDTTRPFLGDSRHNNLKCTLGCVNPRKRVGTPSWAAIACLPEDFEPDEYKRVRFEWETHFKKLKHTKAVGRPLKDRSIRAWKHRVKYWAKKGVDIGDYNFNS